MTTTGSGMQEGTLVIANMSACVCVCVHRYREPLLLFAVQDAPRPRAVPGGWRVWPPPPLPWGGRGGFAEAFPEAAPQVWLQELLEAHPSGLATDVLNPLLPVKLFHLLAGGKI